MIEHESGAKRSKRMPRYDLIPQSGLVRLADRYQLGLECYTEFNWKLGLPFDDTFNHILAHLQEYKERRKRLIQFALETKRDMYAPGELVEKMRELETDGDDLAAAAWGIFALMELEEQGRIV